MTIVSRALVALVAVALFAAPPVAAQSIGDRTFATLELQKQIRKRLVMLPYLSVFDNLAFSVQGSTVTLYGDVTRPSTKHAAERRVDDLPGVARVVNNITVLPVSSFDDAIRARAYRSIFGAGALYRYARGTTPSIRIVVNRGHIRLEGVVASRGDAQLATMAARSVPGAFSVTNNLRIEREN